jgi:SMI1 / KNR4 family (SUKH-1)
MAEKHVTTSEWESWLADWNRELLERIDPTLENRLTRAGISLETHLLQYGVTPETRASGWLGYPGATEDQIARLEARLGKTLPPSYRAFLKASNGFRQPQMLVWRILPAEEVDWFRVRNQQTIDILKPHDLEDLSDTLEISAREIAGSAVYLLNPNVVTGDGEWEALYYAHWQGPNCIHFSSFWDLMQREYKYSVLHQARGEGQLSKEDDLQMIMVKFPSLLKELERKIRSLANDRYLSGTEWSQDILPVLEAAKSRVIEIREKNGSAEMIIRRLEALAVEFREKAAERGRIMGRSDGIQQAYFLVMGSIWWFLNGRHL